MTKIGLAGAGLVGRRHLSALAKAPALTLSAVLDPALAADDLLPRVHSMEALVDVSDGIILAVPNDLHLPMAEVALRAGTPVLVEKPLADTVASGVRLAEVASEHDVAVLVGHHRRHNPVIATARDVLKSGTIGTVTAVQGTCWLPKPDSYYAQAWRQGPGAGPLFINLIHDIDLLMFLCGPISAVQAFESRTHRQTEAEEVAVATLQFESGALGTVNLSDVSVGPWSWELTAGENPAYPKTDQSCYLIGGTKGAIALPNLTVWSQEHGPDWWAPISATRQPVPHADPLAAQLQHFGAVIRGEAKPLVTATDGLRALKVIAAIKTAAQSGTTVQID